MSPYILVYYIFSQDDTTIYSYFYFFPKTRIIIISFFIEGILPKGVTITKSTQAHATSEEQGVRLLIVAQPHLRLPPNRSPQQDLKIPVKTERERSIRALFSCLSMRSGHSSSIYSSIFLELLRNHVVLK